MRCPVCRAADNQTNQCRRCKADLELLTVLERDRAVHVAAAQRHIARGEAQAALVEAQRTHRLRADARSLQLLAMAFLVKKDFGQALAFHGQWVAAKK